MIGRLLHLGNPQRRRRPSRFSLGSIATLFVCLNVLVGSPVSASDRLTFVANVNGNWDLFAADEEGGDPKRLTSTLWDEKDPAWSQNPDRIIHASTDGHLNVVSLHSEDIEKIPILNRSSNHVTPGFSPDGKKIVYAEFVRERGDDSNLMIMDLESGQIRELIGQTGTQLWPAWSPDGSQIVYTNTACTADCGRVIQELWLVDASGGNARQLLLTNSMCQQPDWSPDGRKIAFSSDKAGNFDIWVLNLDDWSLERITDDESLDVSPAWSPDGKRMAFISNRSGGKMGIWIKNLASGELYNFRPFDDDKIVYRDVDW